MIEHWAAALEATALAAGLRGSTWSYPLVNAAHILGVALLVGAVVPLDLRLLGFWSSVPLAPLWPVLTRTASVGFALAASCGALLFITRASEYVESNLFAAKMVFVAVGAANALWLGKPGNASAHPARRFQRIRVAAGVSLVAWIGGLVLGRLVGYF